MGLRSAIWTSSFGSRLVSEATVILDDVEHKIEDDWAVVIPAGTKHNVVNTGDNPLRLYSSIHLLSTKMVRCVRPKPMTRRSIFLHYKQYVTKNAYSHSMVAGGLLEIS